MTRQLASILILPFNAILVIPGLLYVLCAKHKAVKLMPASIHRSSQVLGVVLTMFGFPLLIFTIRDFVKIGQGTLAPWDPTQELVVNGVYRYVRNPMISGVISILFGLTLILNSFCHLAWAILFSVANMIYMPLSEEPGLEQRFGNDYRLYQQNVPRWIPRLQPWEPPAGFDGNR